MSNTPATTATATPYTDLTRSISTDLGKLRGEIPDAKTQAAALRVWCMLQEGKLS